MQEEKIEGYRLSPQQKRLWSLQQACGDLPFRAQCALQIEGALNGPALRAALDQVIDQHQILRTTFQRFYGMTIPLQVITDAGIQIDTQYDFSELEQHEQMNRINALLQQARQLPINFERGPIVCASLARLSSDKHVLILTLPALCSDYIGLENLAREIGEYYTAHLKGEEIAREPMQYIVASELQNDLIAAEGFEVAKAFWGNQREGEGKSTSLPFGKQIGKIESFSPASLDYSTAIDPHLLAQTASRLGLSDETFLLGCWFILLLRLSADDRVTVGFAYSGRGFQELELSIGLYAKYLPITLSLSAQQPISSFFEQLAHRLHQIQGWEDVYGWHRESPSEGAGREVEYLPVLFDYQSQWETYQHDQLSMAALSAFTCIERFEVKLRCGCGSGSETVMLGLDYNEMTYKAEEMELLIRRMEQVVTAVLLDQARMIEELEVISEQERRMVIVEFNRSSREYETTPSIAGMIGRQAASGPDRVAVIYKDQHLSYGEMNRRAAIVARRLRSEGVGREGLVVLRAERSLEAVIGLVGVWKAGGAYVPVEATHPVERMRHVLEETEAKVVMTYGEGSNEEWGGDEEWGEGVKRIRLEEIREEAKQAGEQEDEEEEVDERNLAYVIYTSGSTGRPKGVMVEQRSVKNLYKALREAIYEEEGKERSRKVSLNAPLGFDASVQQVAMLMGGDRLEVIPQEIRGDGEEMVKYLESRRVEVFDCTPTQLLLMIEGGLLGGGRYPEKVMVAGEEMSERMWKEISERRGERRYYNIYGPTESTVDATWVEVEGAERVSIGKVMSNYRGYVLDERKRIVGIGERGELYIGGAGVSRGYIKGEEKTAERYVPEEWSGREGERMYRTGDMVRYEVGGGLEYEGREDGQVKIRGHRIEVGEIEEVIKEEGRVKQCVVRVREDQPGDKKLVAYVIGSDKGIPSSQELEVYLRARLPEFMVPTAWVEMKELPLTLNGKLDLNALPAPNLIAPEYSIAARDSTELHLFSLWSRVLGRNDFGIHDNFFDLGGNSLNAVILLSRVGELYREKLPVRTLFDYPTIALMASHLRREVARVPSSSVVPIQPGGARQPFFCVHPAAGLAQLFIPLARCLGSDQPFYGLESFELDMGRTPSETVDEMANRYANDLRRVQPQGPYRIGGFSFGGVVAYEMARQLHAAGEQVSSLIMLDAALPSNQVDDRPMTEEELQAQVREALIKWSENKLDLPIEQVKAMPVSDLVRLNLNYVKEQGREAAEDGIMAHVTELHYLQMYRNMIANPYAAMRYRPKAYEGCLTLFRGADHEEQGDDYGWGRFALGGVEVYRFNVSHRDFFLSSNMPAIAAQLRSCLEADDSQQKPGDAKPRTAGI